MVDLTASFVTLSGAGFAEPARVPFGERCRAAASAGFSGIGLHHEDFAVMIADGMDEPGLRASAVQCGLDVREIEFLTGWSHGDGSAAAPTLQWIERMALVLSPHHVTAGDFSADVIDVDQAAANLRRICAQLSPLGVMVAVEAFAWSGLRDYATARAVVEEADAPNAGLMIDTWHFYNTRSTTDDLAGLDPDRIAGVQLNDGRIVDGDFLVEARRGRLLPGDGELDVTGLIAYVHRTGFDGPYCVEVSYPEYRDLSVDEMATLAYGKAAAALAAAGVDG
jgi:sugar phosphate isomerase/epimerase